MGVGHKIGVTPVDIDAVGFIFMYIIQIMNYLLN